MKLNQEILNEFCEKNCTAIGCGFFRNENCLLESDSFIHSIYTLMNMVREDCEPNDWLKGLRPINESPYSFEDDFELEEELGKE